MSVGGTTHQKQKKQTDFSLLLNNRNKSYLKKWR